MPSLTTIKHLAIAGLAAEILFEFYAWIISPVLFGVTLQPSNLVIALTKIATGVTLPHAGAFVLHFLIGAFGFVAFVYLTKMVTKLGYIASGFVSGLALWFIAQGILAPVVGRTFMMGFGTYTQSSFVGHVGMTLIAAVIWRALDGRRAVATPQAI
ncbi:putative membrane protein YagU involved in acid resistance [Loktanella ponticola]|uniref:Putative membrane protein YagU involved in acid resistance n=1 Tax=Yoonia ponticola TaxID=1524255 RepID=A0A7W9BKI4_9RHOB|nr:hypothetical protein [Yoonia ponticola]MBB5722145.1 putative membrane protein YagU involved in acid resistance [Yoonia ponticola]